MTKRLKQMLSEHVSVAAIGSPLSPEEHRRVMTKAAQYLNMLTRISTTDDDGSEARK